MIELVKSKVQYSNSFWNAGATNEGRDRYANEPRRLRSCWMEVHKICTLRSLIIPAASASIWMAIFQFLEERQCDE